MKKKAKHIAITIISVAAIALMSVTGYQLYQFWKGQKQTKDTAEKIKQVVEEPSADPETWHPDGSTYRKMKELNPDYVFWLQWDSGLISEPVVQGETNQTYLRSNLFHEYDVYGTIFLDSHTSLLDDNLMLYGHSLVGDHNDRNKFSQLQNMTDQAFYEANRTFKLYYEDHADSYEIVSAFVIDTYSDSYSYEQSSFADQESKNAWIQDAMMHSQITPVTAPTGDDKFVTMQTCAEDYGGKRYVVIARKTGSESIQ